LRNSTEDEAVDGRLQVLVLEDLKQQLDVNLSRLLAVTVAQKFYLLAQPQPWVDTVKHSEELLLADALTLHPVRLHRR